MRRAPWLLIYPTVMLGVLFVVPLGGIVVISLFRRVQGALLEPAFTFDAYARAFSPFFRGRLAITISLAALSALLCVLIGFPFCYLLTRKPRRRQVPYLVLLLALLSLSEVIIAFAWSLLLSRTSGLSNLLVAVGWLPQAVAWSPGFGAVLAGFVFVALPLTVLTFYPTLSRLSPDYVEAARTLGAPPLLAFWNVVLPLMRTAIVGTFMLVFVFVLGAYVIPQILGRPAQWTLPVHITDQAVLQSNLPLAAALAVVLLLVSGVFALLTAYLGRRSP